MERRFIVTVKRKFHQIKNATVYILLKSYIIVKQKIVKSNPFLTLTCDELTFSVFTKKVGLQKCDE